jgi:PhoH-like ATPase
METLSARKKFIVDTSVLLYDSNCFKNFKGNDIILPMTVLEEIDKFKSREGILGENAREVNRFLDELRSVGSLHAGVFVKEHNINVKVELKYDFKGLGIDVNDNDNKIIATANFVKNTAADTSQIVKIISKDINLRVKSDAVKIPSDDYYADYAFITQKNEEEKFYQGHKEIFVEDNIVNGLYNSEYVFADKMPEDSDLSENECVTLKTYEGQSALGIKKKDKIVLVQSGKKTLGRSVDITPKNKEQTFALQLLNDEEISLVTLTGVPGSGKTYLTLMSALKEIEQQKKQRIIFTRPIQTVGKDIGFLPGTLNEKMAPWLAPIVDNFRNQFGDLAYFELMMEKGIIDVAPLSYIRGRSFNDAIIIVDEAQNATVHELKTVITRTGKNSKIVLLGDIEQIDLPYVNKYSNGLTIVIEKLKDTYLTGHINFKKGYRSELANIVAEKL